MVFPDVGGQHCPCPVLVSFLSGFPVKSCLVSVCYTDSFRIFHPVSVSILSGNFVKNAVQCLSVRIFCPDSVYCSNSVRILEKKLPVFSLSDRTRTRQSCPDFHCTCPPTSGLSKIGDESLKFSEIL